MTDTSQPRQRRKPGRVPTSCAECRRLKLKCDQQVPCGKCQTRGCSSICPDGVLATGRGNRLVLANTKELHEEIDKLRRRVRELEEGLQTLQDSISYSPHPLLRPELLQIKNPSSSITQPQATNGHANGHANGNSDGSSPEANGAVATNDFEEQLLDDPDGFVNSFGTLSIGVAGEVTFLGKTARSEYLIQAVDPPGKPQRAYPRISKNLTTGACGDEARPFNQEVAEELFEMLPRMSEAIYLCELYLDYGKYFYVPIPRDQLFDELLTSIYKDQNFTSFVCYPALSLLYIVFAIGALYDPHREPYSMDAEEFYQLARSAYTQGNERSGSLICLQSAFHMAQYLDLSNVVSTVSNQLWTLKGHSVQMAHSMGLHLNSARFKLDEKTSNRRHLTFWQLLVFDAWTSLWFGRPPSISLAFADCPIPKDFQPVIAENGEPENGYHVWTMKFACMLHRVMETAFGTKSPTYSVLLGLDRQIRDFHVPTHLRPFEREENPAPMGSRYMQRWMVLSAKETTLLNLHRGYFAQALKEMPHDLAAHRYIPSVMAAYRSAWRLGQGLRCAWRSVPEILARHPLAWSQALSAAVVMCLLVTRAPTSKMAQPSLDELDLLCNLFESAASTCKGAANNLDSIQKLRQKAHETSDFSLMHDGLFGSITPSELDRLGGKTHLLALSPFSCDDQGRPILNTSTSPSSGDSPNSHPSSSSNNPSPPDQTTYHAHMDGAGAFTQSNGELGDPLSTANVHPTIARDINNDFENLLARPPSYNTNIFDFPAADSSSNGGAVPPLPEPSAMHEHPAVDGEMPDLQFTDTGGLFGPPGALMPVVGMDLRGQSPGSAGSNPPYLDSTWQNFVEQLGF